MRKTFINHKVVSLSDMTMYAKREKFNKLSIKIGRFFSKFPLSPNQWTLFSLVPAVVAAYALTQLDFLSAAVLFAVAGLLDLVDGSVARVTGRVSKFGAYFDSVADRYIEGVILFGLLFAQLPWFYFPIQMWIFVALFGSMMTTYVKAAAKESEIITEGIIKGGLFERAERMVLLFFGIVAAIWYPLALTVIIVILAFLTNWSAIERILIARNIAKPSSKAKKKRR